MKDFGSQINDPVTRVSFHTEVPPLTGGGFLEMVGSREMLRLGDELEASSDGRYFKLTESWKPGNFDKHLYAQA